MLTIQIFVYSIKKFSIWRGHAQKKKEMANNEIMVAQIFSPTLSTNAVSDEQNDSERERTWAR